MCEKHTSCESKRHNHGDGEYSHGGECTGGVTRRAVVAGGLGLAAAMAGCLGSDGDGPDDAEPPEPIGLDQDDQCELCGMVIPNHPGPVAEIFYENETPSGHENPARFCSAWEAFQYDFERADEGWNRLAFYTTDYSSVDYDLYTDSGITFITAHVEAAAFADATTLTFVAGSEVRGAMGRDIIGFSEASDAEELQREYGGELATFDEVGETLIRQLASQ